MNNSVEQRYNEARQITDDTRLYATASHSNESFAGRTMTIEVQDYDALVKYIEYLEQVYQGKQAKIDELMLEFTPENVTEEQFKE